MAVVLVIGRKVDLNKNAQTEHFHKVLLVHVAFIG